MSFNIPVGQTTKDNSLPVTIATDQPTIDVSISSSSLPSGAATSAKQDTGNASLASIDGKITTVNTGAVVVASSALPSGAATAALQTQPGIDIGDVTINNASGIAAVNIQDGGNSITVDGPITDSELRASPVPISAASLPLPSGASTSALQTTGNSSLSSIDGKVPSGLTVTATRLLTDGSGVTQPISASSLPLPSGAATSALQTQPGVDIGDVTINNSTGASAVNIQDGGNSITVDNSTLSVVGGGTEITAIRVTLASDSTGLISVDDNGGSLTVDGSITANAGTNLNTSALNLETTQSAMSAKLPATLGQKVMTASMAVVVASDQTSIPVAATLQAGSALVGKVGIDQTTPGTTNKVSIGTDGTVIANAGTNLNTSALALNTTLTDKSQFSKITDGTDTALITGSGELNVLATAQPGIDIGDVTINNAAGASAVNIQDGGNSITIDGSLSTVTSLTQMNGAAISMNTGVRDAGTQRVTIATNDVVPSSQSGTWTVQPGNTVNTTPWLNKEARPSTSSVTSVASSATNVTLLASNANRIQATFYNDSTKTLYLKFGATATTSSYTVQMSGGSFFELPFPCYTGIIDGIWSSANGNCRITEVTI